MGDFVNGTSHAGHGQQDTVYGRFKSHFSANRGDTEVNMFEAVRSLHPDKHVTEIPVFQADLMEFAEAGKATARLIRNGEEFLAYRGYTAPTGRQSATEGKLFERVKFGLHEYSYDGDDFLVYVMDWPDADNQGTTLMQFVLAPKTDVDAENHSPTADKLIKAAGRYSTDLHEEIYVFDGGYWAKNHKLWEAVQSSFWEDVILDPAMKDTLIKDVDNFFDSRAVYKEYSVPWKRGVIFHGSPGCGKTISIKALMNALQKRDVASLYVKSFKGCQGMQHSIRSIFSQAREMAPCMLVFEDLDSLVVDEVRSYFLNEIDGLEDNDGMLIIGSTNHLDRLDPGIAKRPSRFDRKYHYKLPGERERVLYCQYWRQKLQQNSSIEFHEDICNVVAQLTEGFSFAYLKELFVQTLLAIVGGRADLEDDTDDGYVTVTDTVAEETKVVDDSAKLAKDGETTTSTKEKSGEEKKEPKKKMQMPEVEIPEHLKESSLMRILRKQTKALFQEMDNTEDDGIHARPKFD
ncbi:hypothetical protein DOTSEDRAFT_72104 [Lecanosticta acicola]|uniref:AAA+ ATPase domain-containing protein n=1 Tax=Lecanosticta acicola TaxID=111012 RepID=A0AAI8Z5T4_9PEZI|nr:hypothetical protein DOTSEDRAFT_72104 [Lecanosticta acicola]